MTKKTPETTTLDKENEDHKRLQEARLDLAIRNLGDQYPETERSRVIDLLDRIIGKKSQEMILLMYSELSRAGMIRDLREIHRTLVLRLMTLHLTHFLRTEGHFPEFREGCSEEEFLLASWLHLQLNGPDLYFRGL